MGAAAETETLWVYVSACFTQSCVYASLESGFRHISEARSQAGFSGKEMSHADVLRVQGEAGSGFMVLGSDSELGFPVVSCSE